MDPWVPRLLNSIEKDIKTLGADIIPANTTDHIIDLTEQLCISKWLDTIQVKQASSISFINCCGLIYNRPLIRVVDSSPLHSMADWEKTLSPNTAFSITSASSYYLFKNRLKGVVINFSSIASKGMKGQIAYSAAKAAIQSMSISAAKELGQFGIRFVTISPGFIDTRSTQSSLSTYYIEKYKNMNSLRRLGSIDNILSTVEYIVSNNYLTGVDITVDGCQSIQ